MLFLVVSFKLLATDYSRSTGGLWDDSKQWSTSGWFGGVFRGVPNSNSAVVELNNSGTNPLNLNLSNRRVVNNLNVSGNSWNLRGDTLALSSPYSFSSSQAEIVYSGSKTLTLETPLDLQANTILNVSDPSGTVEFQGNVTGNNIRLRKTGAGTFVIRGPVDIHRNWRDASYRRMDIASHYDGGLRLDGGTIGIASAALSNNGHVPENADVKGKVDWRRLSVFVGANSQLFAFDGDINLTELYIDSGVNLNITNSPCNTTPHSITIQGLMDNYSLGEALYDVTKHQIGTIASYVLSRDTLQSGGTINQRSQGDLIFTGMTSLNNINTINTQAGYGSIVLNGRAATNIQMDGGQLKGTGGSTGDLTATNEAIISPGYNGSVGTLSFGNVNLDPSTILDFTLGRPNTIAQNDRIQVNGNLTLAGGLNIQAGPGFRSGVYTLFDYTGNLTYNGLRILSGPKGYRFGLQSGYGQVNLLVKESRSQPEFGDHLAVYTRVDPKLTEGTKISRVATPEVRDNISVASSSNNSQPGGDYASETSTIENNEPPKRVRFADNLVSDDDYIDVDYAVASSSNSQPSEVSSIATDGEASTGLLADTTREIGTIENNVSDDEETVLVNVEDVEDREIADANNLESTDTEEKKNNNGEASTSLLADNTSETGTSNDEESFEVVESVTPSEEEITNATNLASVTTGERGEIVQNNGEDSDGENNRSVASEEKENKGTENTFLVDNKINPPVDNPSVASSSREETPNSGEEEFELIKNPNSDNLLTVTRVDEIADERESVSGSSVAEVPDNLLTDNANRPDSIENDVSDDDFEVVESVTSPIGEITDATNLVSTKENKSDGKINNGDNASDASSSDTSSASEHFSPIFGNFMDEGWNAIFASTSNDDNGQPQGEEDSAADFFDLFVDALEKPGANDSADDVDRQIGTVPLSPTLNQESLLAAAATRVDENADEGRAQEEYVYADATNLNTNASDDEANDNDSNVVASSSNNGQPELEQEIVDRGDAVAQETLLAATSNSSNPPVDNSSVASSSDSETKTNDYRAESEASTSHIENNEVAVVQTTVEAPENVSNNNSSQQSLVASSGNASETSTITGDGGYKIIANSSNTLASTEANNSTTTGEVGRIENNASDDEFEVVDHDETTRSEVVSVTSPVEEINDATNLASIEGNKSDGDDNIASNGDNASEAGSGSLADADGENTNDFILDGLVKYLEHQNQSVGSSASRNTDSDIGYVADREYNGSSNSDDENISNVLDSDNDTPVVVDGNSSDSECFSLITDNLSFENTSNASDSDNDSLAFVDSNSSASRHYDADDESDGKYSDNNMIHCVPWVPTLEVVERRQRRDLLAGAAEQRREGLAPNNDGNAIVDGVGAPGDGQVPNAVVQGNVLAGAAERRQREAAAQERRNLLARAAEQRQGQRLAEAQEGRDRLAGAAERRQRANAAEQRRDGIGYVGTIRLFGDGAPGDGRAPNAVVQGNVLAGAAERRQRETATQERRNLLARAAEQRQGQRLAEAQEGRDRLAGAAERRQRANAAEQRRDGIGYVGTIRLFGDGAPGDGSVVVGVPGGRCGGAHNGGVGGPGDGGPPPPYDGIVDDGGPGPGDDGPPPPYDGIVDGGGPDGGGDGGPGPGDDGPPPPYDGIVDGGGPDGGGDGGPGNGVGVPNPNPAPFWDGNRRWYNSRRERCLEQH